MFARKDLYNTSQDKEREKPNTINIKKESNESLPKLMIFVDQAVP